MLLLRPQRLKRAATGASDEALLDDLLSLIGKIGVDKVSGGTILSTLEACAEPLGLRLVQRAGGGFDHAIHRLQDLLSPLSHRLQALGSSLSAGPGVPQVADFAVTLLSTLAEGATGLSIQTLRDRVGTILDVVQNDLGLTSAAIEAEIWSLFDDVVARLEAIPAEADAAVRENRLAVVAIIKRIKLRLQGVVHLPDLSADRVASALFDELKGGGIAAALDKVACVGKGLGAGLTVATDLAKIVPFTGFGSHSLGAGEGSPPTTTTTTTVPPPDTVSKYLWYGSWLLGDKNRTDWQKVFGSWILLDLWRPKRDVWVGGDSQVWFGDNLLQSGTDITWDQLPNLIDVTTGGVARPHPRYTFKRVSAPVMEDIARHTAWVIDALEALQHIVSMSGLTITKGGMVSVTDLLELLEVSGMTVFEAVKQMPWKFFIRRKTSSFGGFALGTALPFLAFNFPGTFQGLHTNATAGEGLAFYGLLFLSDLINMIGAGLIGGALRDGLLSWLTIINYDPSVGDSTSADNRPDNRSQIDGIVGLFTFLSTLVLVKVVVDRKDYGVQSSNFVPLAKLILEYGLLAVWGSGCSAGPWGPLRPGPSGRSGGPGRASSMPRCWASPCSGPPSARPCRTPSCPPSTASRRTTRAGARGTRRGLPSRATRTTAPPRTRCPGRPGAASCASRATWACSATTSSTPPSRSTPTTSCWTREPRSSPRGPGPSWTTSTGSPTDRTPRRTRRPPARSFRSRVRRRARCGTSS